MTEPKIDFEKMFESGSMLNRNYAGHEQMLMNEGTFVEISKEIVKEAIRLAAPLFAEEAALNDVTRNNLINKQSIIDVVEKVTNQIIGK